MMMSHLMLWFIHHAQHGNATSTNKTYHKNGRQEEKQDIKYAGIVPLDALGDSNHVAVLRNDAQRLEKKLDHISGSSHCDIECHQNIAHHFPAIIFTVDVQDGQDNQIGKDEADHAAKADAAPPENRRQRHITHRTHKTHDSNQWPNQWPFNL